VDAERTKVCGPVEEFGGFLHGVEHAEWMLYEEEAGLVILHPSIYFIVLAFGRDKIIQHRYTFFISRTTSHQTCTECLSQSLCSLAARPRIHTSVVPHRDLESRNSCHNKQHAETLTTGYQTAYGTTTGVLDAPMSIALQT
jgi:hypothetical protein